MLIAYLIGLISYSIQPGFPVLEKQNGILKNDLQTNPEQTASSYVLVDPDGQQPRGRGVGFAAPRTAPLFSALLPVPACCSLSLAPYISPASASRSHGWSHSD